MNGSKLEVCVTVLQVLNSVGQMGATKIASTAKINQRLLGECVSILAEQDMVEEQRQSDRTIYQITANGKRALGFFKLNVNPERNEILDVEKRKARAK